MTGLPLNPFYPLRHGETHNNAQERLPVNDDWKILYHQGTVGSGA
jgi:hypothetical protein